MTAYPKSVFGAVAAIASGHHLATQAAKDCLENGGSLIDAMICASAVLAVALPHATSLGGCGMLLYLDGRSGTVHGLNGTGRAPLAADHRQFMGGMPQRGVRAAVVPTLIRLWARAHERFGRQKWSRLLEPAISHAEDGIATPEELARNLGRLDPEHARQPGFDSLFQPSGQPLAPGEILRQPKLAAVLKKIAACGEDGFYLGDVAASLASFSSRHGGLFTLDDLAAAQADWVEPWFSDIGSTRAYVMPPNSVGVLMLRQLAMWHAAGRQAGTTGAVSSIENAIAAIAHGRKLIGDPSRRAPAPADFGLGHPDTATPHPSMLAANRLDKGDTAGFVAMDQEGNAISMLQSVFQPFGSCAVDEATGVLLNNRMFDFSAEPGGTNSIGPAMRPSHTLNPWLLARDGQADMAGASPGGISQTTTGAQIIEGALDSPQTLGKLVSRPRWSLSRAGEILLEPGMPDAIADALRAKGYSVVENSDHEFYFGSAKLIRRTAQGWFEAAADTRRQAVALAW